MKVLIGCECSGIVRNAFRAKGHDAWSCDLQPADDKSPFHLQYDLLKAIYAKPWHLLIAHPVCKFLTVAGARWMKDSRYPTRQLDMDKAAKFFMDCYNAPIGKVAIENPIGIMSTRFREPDQIIQPYWFGHAETKSTCLWLRNLPLLVKKYYVMQSASDDPNRIHNLFLTVSDKEKLSKLRSETYRGVALAMADQWG